MNKKIKIGLLILVCIVLIALSIYLSLNSKKDSMFIVYDSYSEEITDFSSNTMPFLIEPKEEVEIKVNGKQYNGERIYKVGEYNIEVSNGTKQEKTFIKINEVEKSKEHEYSIYVSNATLPALFNTLKLVNDKEQKGYLWTSRVSTLNLETIENNFPNIKLSSHNGERSLQVTILDEIKDYIKEIVQQDKNAYFHLYTIEANFSLDLELFGKIGLDDSRYDSTIYTDGTLGYVRKYDIAQENSYDQFLEEKENYTQIVESIKSNTVDSTELSCMSYDYLWISTLKNNISFKTQYPELIEFKDEKVKAELEKANIKKINAIEEYTELENKSKALFGEIINLNKEELDNKYFSDKNDEYLIITGTTPFYGKYTQEEFEEIIKKIVEDYKNEYTILYKPHPSSLPTEAQESYLNNLEIKVLPASIPMEAILFIYPHLNLGGFGSSLYMTLEKDKAKFFFGKDEDSLVEPLNILYNQLFSKAKFYDR